MTHDDMTWIVCDCHGDAIAVWNDPDDGYVWMEFWTSGTSGPEWGWRTRWRNAWLWLCGRPETPSAMILTINEARRLAEVLNIDIDHAEHRDDQPEGVVASGA